MRICSKILILCGILCLSLTMLAGCDSDSPGKETTGGSSGVPAVQDGYPIPVENRKGVGIGEICPSTAADGYYLCVNSVIHYYDAESGTTFTLCAQPGCSHQDSTCQAWIGDVTSYTEYHGSIFAIVQEEGGTIRFLRKDLSDGSISVFDTWENSDTTSYSASVTSLADQAAVISLNCYTRSVEDGTITIHEQDSLWWYDLASEERREIWTSDQAEELRILAVSADHLVVLYTPQDQTLLEPDEFASQFGEQASYGRYLHRATQHELRLYDAEMSAYTVIASTEQDQFVSTVDSCSVYGKEVVYQCDDTIYLLNADSGETKPLLTMENIINYWVMDHKVFLITQNMDYYIASNPEKEVSIYYADFDDGLPVKLGNGGSTEGMEFSISQEGTSFFVGRWNGGTYIISKSDFYTDQYANAKQIG